ncbi:MAG: Uma2 family endonuclease [Aquificaceae bacterium]|uniref:Uma2 family endonuclease n=1 Tax=Hydrogenobacter sp. Uz 6-8 TaxID=3384828 RepID=UPI0030A71E84
MEVKTKLTTEEFFKLYPEESRVELIDGEVYEMPAPSFVHQEVVARIFIPMRLYSEESRLGKVVFSPIDVVLDEGNVLQPDIVFVSDAGRIGKNIQGAPDLLVEVVSPSTLIRDLTDKMKIYERNGVQEYWIVFPLEKAIIVYTLSPEGYELFSSAVEKGKVRSKALKGFELEVEEVFKGL